MKCDSLRKHPFLLAIRRWGRFTRRKKYYEVLTNCYEKSKLSASHGTETHFE